MRILVVLLLFSSLVACSSEPGPATEKNGPVKIEVWAHAGQEGERATISRQVADFNQSQDRIAVNLTFLPERDYNSQVQAAAVANTLPDLLEFDGPLLYNYVWQGHLVPLNDLLPDSLKQDLLPSIIKQGTYQKKLYGVGVFDSGLGLYGRRSLLEAAGVRIPAGPQDAWSGKEFGQVLARLATKDEDGLVLDLKLNYPAEWFTYGFSPLIQSAGADLIDRRTWQSARGLLNGPAAVAALRDWQSWLSRVDMNVDDAAMITGRVALSWVGHWEYPRYRKTFDEDLIILPLPDMGSGSRTGQGSWQWGITTRCQNRAAAATFIKYLLTTEEVLAMSRANGAVPATRSGIGASDLYNEQGPLHLFAVQLLKGYSIPRPQTPAYPVITSAFHRALLDIRDGKAPQAALDRAVKIIDQDIRDNKGYR